MDKKEANLIYKIKFLDNLWDSKKNDDKRFVRGLKNLIRIIWAATTRFKDDEDLTRAGAIAYQVIVSAIPLLVVGLFVLDTVGDVKTFEALAKEFARKNDLSLDVSVYFNIFYSLLDNKGALTGIGLLIVILSATSILNKLEDALNRIWGVKKPKPFMIRMAFFVLVIVFGPFLVVVGIQSGQDLVNQFSSPTLQSIRFFQDKAIVVGDKHVFMERTQGGNWEQKKILNSIDFDTQKSPVVFDSKTNKLLLGVDLDPYRDRIRTASYSQLTKVGFQDVAMAGKRMIIITRSGSIITSEEDPIEEEVIRKVRQYQRVEGNVLIPAKFTKIRMWTDSFGTIIGDRGLILKTQDGGMSWQPCSVPGIEEDLNDVDMIGEGKYLAVGQNFSAVISTDSGNSWQLYTNHLTSLGNNLDTSNETKVNLNSIFRKGNSIYIAGDVGTILYSKDNGGIWNKKDIGLKGIDFQDLLFLDENNGIVVGDSGSIRYTTDGGFHWKKAKSGTKEDLWFANYDPIENKIFVAGNNNKLLSNTNGNQDLSEYKIIKSSPLWRVSISFLGNALLPFAFIWAVIFILYKGLPNANVGFKSAGIGATVTAILWVIFLVGFRYYSLYFLDTKFAIYGALAAIPLILLLVNLSVMIVLYGGEIGYLIQNPAMAHITYKQRVLKRIEQHQVWWGVRILHLLFENFHKGKGETKEKELLKICHHNETEFLKIIEVFQSNKWIGKYKDNSWIPIIASENIKIRDIVVAVSPSGYDIEDYTEKDAFKKKLGDLFSRIELNRDEILGDLKLKDLIES